MLPIRLGLCIPKGKRSRIGFPGRILALCEEANIHIIEIDLDNDIDAQGPFDVLLHKVLDLYNEQYDGHCLDGTQRKIDKLVSYAALHPRMIVLDDFRWCWRLTNRKFMIELIKACTFTMNGLQVLLPKTIDITEKLSFNSIKCEVNERRVRFPVLVKPYSAYFDEGAHVMALVFSMDALRKIKKPYLLQEFCNHSAVCYKVYVVGKNFHICERPSIKDLDNNQSSQHSSSTIFFDSFRVSKTGNVFNQNLHENDPNKRYWFSSDEKANLLDYDVIREIISRIHHMTGLYLYGFDILIEKGTKNYAFIDINQFPSYKGIGEMHLPRDLVELVKDFFK